MSDPVKKIERMTNDQKGYLLLDNIRNIAIQSGEDENLLIHLLTHEGAMLEILTSVVMRNHKQKHNKH